MLAYSPQKTFWLCAFAAILLLSSCSSEYPVKEEIAAQLPEKVDFNYHIRPILSDRCYKCHGPDANQREAELRLDDPLQAHAAREGDDGKRIYPLRGGNLSKSEAFQRIISNDPDEMMPPPESNLFLSELDKAMIARWIEQGAEYKEHWSFVAPEKEKSPRVKEKNWAKQPFDKFIQQKVEKAGIPLASEAPKEALLRRISLDLTGLPPSPAEIDAFLANESPNAYEQEIDRLMASPHFGERLGVEWLDVARYADTHGYQDDGMRNTWPWRDWVIRKFNENMPYDQFLVEQLAGDLLPNPTRDQLLATCFNRNHPQSQEGGVVDEEYRVEYVVDRTNTFGKALMGLTVECAQCHDHKYDPISQEEYYSLYAYFNNNNDAGIVPYNGEAAPTVMLPTPKEEAKLDSIRQAMEPYQEGIVSEKYKEDLGKWLEQKQPKIKTSYGLVADFSFETAPKVPNSIINLDNRKNRRKSKGTTTAYVNKTKRKADAAVFGDSDQKPLLVEGKEGKGVQFIGDAGIRFNRDLDFDRHQPFSVSIWVKPLKAGEKGPIFNNTNGDFEGYRGWICKLNEDGTLSFQLNHVWPDNCIDYVTLDTLEVNKWTHIAMSYDGGSYAKGLRFYINGKTPKHKLLKDNLNKSLLHGVKGSNWSNFPFILGKEKERSIENIVMDELRVFDRELSEIEVLKLYNPALEITPSQEQWLEYYVLSGQNKNFNKNLKDLTNLRKIENLVATDVLEVMIMHDRDEVRPTFILDRGMYDAPTEEVEAATPAVLPRMPEDYPQNRLGLAQWLVSGDHPLTARVAVNRFWYMLFGRGLVATQGDFGSQGNLPTHPELLDWLAADFVENGWDIKAFFKQIMMSSTYRQSSIASDEARGSDPNNKLYSHFPAHRLSAELIRDHALASSGLLSDSIGGPSSYPYQPDGIWAALATRNATKYEQGEGEDLYRRSMYTVWKRSSPPPSMMNFDAPDRYYCVVSRQKTATPLQSLVLMNDPQFIEASKMMASRAVKEGGADVEDRIDFMYKCLIGRGAKEQEKSIMQELYQEELTAFQEDEKRAESLLGIGEADVDPELDTLELAAHTILASTIMNFDEFVMKR